MLPMAQETNEKLVQEIDKNYKRSKKQVLQKKPNPILYWGAREVVNVLNKKQFNITATGEKVCGPALLLSNHTSNFDYKFIAGSVRPAHISFLATYHWFTFKKLAFWLKAIGAIPKYQFTTDLESMKKIKYIVQEKKGVVYIAPEGTVYSSGHLGYISPAIAKMIRFLKVPVYASKIQGAGLGNAKWSKNIHKGKVLIETHLLFTEEEAKTLPANEIMERLTKALSYNEFEFQKKYNVKVLGDDKALGFETMFYKCPICGKEFHITTSGNDVCCTSCGAKATIQDDFTFKWNRKNPRCFENYSQWYDWQLEEMLKAVSNPNFKLSEEVEYGYDEPGVDNYVKAGRGIMTFSHSGWDYKGTFKGEHVQEHDDANAVFLATLKIGLHFELPYKYGHCRVFYPKNGLHSMRWHLASLAMSMILKNR